MKRLLLLSVLVGGTMAGTPGCSKYRPILYVLQWENYFAADTISNFEKEFGCQVVVTNFGSADELRAKLDRVPSGYDVAFPSDEILPQLIEAGKLEKLDLSKIPDFKNIASRFRGAPADPKNDYSLPYMWGTTGIAYNVKEVSPAPDSWKVLWEAKYVSRMTMLEDRREVFAAAMLANGDDPKNPTAETIEKAKKKLLERKPLAYGVPREKLIAGDYILSQCYNGDASEAAASDERKTDIAYVIPKEGGTLWFDSVTIPAKPKNRDLAHAFLNYLMRPAVSAAISNARFYANPNELAQQHIRKEIRENPLIYPSEETLKRCYYLPPLAPALRKKMDGAWEEVRGK